MEDRTFRVLLVEDDEDDVVIARKLLARVELSHYAVDWAASYAEGLERVLAGGYDVCLLDYRLGEQNGLDLLREAVAQACQVPFILLTGEASRALDVEAAQAGASDYMVKGQITAPLLERSIRYAIERERHEAELKKARDAALEATRLKSEFLATMSHELRTPLTAILGFTGTLLMELSGPLNPDQQEQLQIVESSANHLLSLINDLLDLAKIEAGKVELDCEPVVCQSVLQEVATTLRPLAEGKGLRLEMELPDQDLVVWADRRALSQIVINLTNNAIKFTETGAVRLALARPPAQGHPATHFRVSDTGGGIQPEDQAKLFQAFEQARAGSWRQHKGTGLGLHLSQKLAGLLGGYITCESEYGVGSTFTLILSESA